MAEEAQPKAKTLIADIEKGALITSPGPLSPEMIDSELAPSGTAKSLMSMFEKTSQPEEPPQIVRKTKTPSTSSTNGIEEKPNETPNDSKQEEKQVEKQEETAKSKEEVPAEQTQAAPTESNEVKQVEEVIQAQESVTTETQKVTEEPVPAPKTTKEPAVVETKAEPGVKRKNVMIVYATDDEQSLVYAMVDAAKSHFTEKGCDVVLTDLLGDNFNPVVSAKDIGGRCRQLSYNLSPRPNIRMYKYIYFIY